MAVNERQKSILDAVIHEFVQTAEPVSSACLVDKYRFPFSPATVRNDFLALDEAGFLEQPHTSAGRIPTEKGYRFFVDTREDKEKNARARRELKTLRTVRNKDDFARILAKIFGDLSDSLVCTAFPEENFFHTAGFARVLGEPEFNDAGMRNGFARLVDHIEDVMDEFETHAKENVSVFIGSENPVREARSFSMIIGSYETPFAKRGIVSMVGPTRMDYEQNLSLIRELQKLL